MNNISSTNYQRILLINPNTVRPAIPPIGLEYINEYLVHKGISTRIYDFGIDNSSSLADLIKSFSPDLIGISIRNIDDGHLFHKNHYLPHIKKVVWGIRQITDAKICLGGIGFSIMPVEIMEYTSSDYGIVGEGEQSLYSLMMSPHSPDDIPRLLYRNNQREICTSHAQDSYRDEEDLNLQRFSLDYEAYLQGGSIFNLQTVRGCNRKCVFCPEPEIQGKRLRFRNPRLVVDEMRTLKRKGVEDKLYFVDSEFNVKNDHAHEVADAIASDGPGIGWSCYMSPQGVDRELIRTTKKAGCDVIVWGIESACDSMLDSLKKDFSVEDIDRVNRYCKQEGQKAAYTILFGGPGETLESVKETYDNLKTIGAENVAISCGIRIFPQTSLYAHSIEDNEISADTDILEPIYYREDYIKSTIYPFVKDIFSSMDSAVLLGPNCSTPYVDAEFQDTLRCSRSLDIAFKRN